MDTNELCEGIDPKVLLDMFRKVVEVDSPVGYYADIEPVLSRMVGEWGY